MLIITNVKFIQILTNSNLTNFIQIVTKVLKRGLQFKLNKSKFNSNLYFLHPP